MSDIIKKEDSEIQSALIEIVKRKDIDPDRLEKFLDIQIKMEERQQKKLFQEALSNFQKSCPIIVKRKQVKFTSKSGSTTQYNYSPLDEIVAIIKPFLASNGLSYSFDIVKLDKDQSELVTTIYHSGGHEKTSSYFFYNLHDDARMNQSQRAKSSITFAKRAGLENALGLVSAESDDDARRATDTMATTLMIDEIEDLIKNTGADRERIFNYLKVSNLEDLTINEAKSAILLLRQKRIGLKKNKEIGNV
jgi:hypothetical protein